MTFSEFIIRSRRRLLDIRTRTGAIIDTATDDGLRWSADVLEELCRGAIVELLRTFTALKLHQNVNEAVTYRIISGLKIEAGTGLLTGAGITGTNFTKVLKIQTTDLKRIYSFIDQEAYFGSRYYTSELTDGTRPIDDAVFTVFYDETSKKAIVRTLPLYADEIVDVQAIVRVPYESLFTLESTEQLPITDATDLLYDVVEREARRIEHNYQQYQILTQVISNKLMEAMGGLPRSQR